MRCDDAFFSSNFLLLYMNTNQFSDFYFCQASVNGKSSKRFRVLHTNFSKNVDLKNTDVYIIHCINI